MSGVTGQVEVLKESTVAKSLVERILQNDALAEVEMVKRYQRGLMAMLFNRSRDKNIADEVAQETWSKVLVKLRSNDLRNPERLAAYIIQIAKNQLIMWYRQHKKFELSDDIDVEALEACEKSPEQIAMNEQMGRQMQDVLNHLSQPRDQEIIKRFYLSGDNKQQLCKDFKLTPAHFDRVLHRAKTRFKDLWENNQRKNQ